MMKSFQCLKTAAIFIVLFFVVHVIRYPSDNFGFYDNDEYSDEGRESDVHEKYFEKLLNESSLPTKSSMK